MEQAFSKFLMFRNRLEKVFRHLSRTARKQGISCFRIYDHDIPEFPLRLELYGDSLYVSEYKRRFDLSDEAHEAWMDDCKRIMSEITNVPTARIFFRIRKRKEGRQDQYQKMDDEQASFFVEENGLKFFVNLSDYLDTGLFLDHRITRAMVRSLSKDKRVLNLFCYTGSFSVYAAAGEARSIDSVDLSRTYLAWTEKNMRANFPDYTAHRAIHADALEYLARGEAESVDLIILDPPTFSNSKRMDDILDIQRDHAKLINDSLRMLAADGVLIFSTNYTKFQPDIAAINTTSIRDITAQTTPFDFAGRLQRPCFRIQK